MALTNDEKQRVLEAVMSASLDALADHFGEEVGVLMLVKEQDNVETCALTNLDPRTATEIAKGFVKNADKAEKVSL